MTVFTKGHWIETVSLSAIPIRRGWVKAAVLVLTCLMRASCVTVTPYQEGSWTGGYYEREVAPDTFSITFDGNNNVKRDTLHSYLLYRCAELTVERGYDYFILMKERHKWINEGAVIKIIKGPIPTDQVLEKTYNARELIQELRSKYPELQKVPLPKGFDSGDRS